MPRKLIMCGDHPVLAFEYDPESGRACSSGEVLDHDRLPLEFTTHGKSALYAKRIDEWWRSRAIPSTVTEFAVCSNRLVRHRPGSCSIGPTV